MTFVSVNTDRKGFLVSWESYLPVTDYAEPGFALLVAPYMTQARPSFTNLPTNIGYGATFNVTVDLPPGASPRGISGMSGLCTLSRYVLL